MVMRFLDPRDVLKQFGVYGTERVADLGAGSGHFSLNAALRLDGGALFAVDADTEMLKRLSGEANEKGCENIHCVAGDLACVGGVPLSDELLDKAIASNVLFQVHDRDAFVKEAKRLLRPEGELLVVEWKEDAPLGPHPRHRVSLDSIMSLFKKHGFRKKKDVDAGDYHYGIIFVRS